ncbi:MAG: zinc-ribbon domain-containing protein [Oscillospiraceae bacterium]|nr:zinc-ribbon domain-containing protein [Oscillospiraceae bacterium]
MKFCQKCGKEIMDEAVICPSCGCAIKNDVASAKVVVPKSAKNAKIFGILSILLLAPFGIPAIILANKSKQETGGIMCKQAKTGFVCGIIGLCWWGLNLILLLGGM